MENVSWVFRRWGICVLSLLLWNHGMVWGKRGLNDHLIPPPFLLLSLISPALFRQQSQLHFHLSWKTIPQPHPSLSRFFLVLFQSFPCSAEPGCSVTPNQARLGHCHHLPRSVIPFFWDFAEGSWAQGASPSAAVE